MQAANANCVYIVLYIWLEKLGCACTKCKFYDADLILDLSEAPPTHQQMIVLGRAVRKHNKT